MEPTMKVAIGLVTFMIIGGISSAIVVPIILGSMSKKLKHIQSLLERTQKPGN